MTRPRHNLSPEMRSGTRERPWTAGGIALAAHVALLFAASELAPPRAVPRLGHALVPTATELDVELEAGVPAPAESAPSTSNATGSSAPVVALRSLRGLPERAPTRSSGGDTSEPSAGSASGAPGAPGTESTEATPEPTPPRPLASLGIGASDALLPRRDRAPNPTRAAESRVERSLAKGLADHDRELGLGSGGPILGAIERATYSSGVPANGSALFLAQIDSGGRLRLLDVIESTDTRWSKVAARALASLRTRKLRVAAGSRGVELRIRVSSREVLPSGADPGLEVRALGLPLKKGRGKRSSRLSLLEPMARLDYIDVPTPSGESVRLPVLSVGIGIIGVAGDPSDIGATPRRVVHATVENEQPL